LRARWRFLLSVAGLFLACLSLVLAPERLRQPITYASLGLSALTFLLGVRQLRREREYSLEFGRLDEGLIARLRPPGWKIFRTSNRAAIYSPEINRALPASRVTYQLVSPAFQLPQTVSPYCHIILNRRRLGIISNEGKVGQRTDLDEQLLQSGHPVLFYETDYYNGLFTNDMALQKLVKPKGINARSELLVSGTWFFVEDDGTLARLSHQKASNHIGVSTIAVFDDVDIPLVVQSRRSLQSSGQIAPSGSGSADFERAELSAGGFLAKFIADEMERELREELGLPPSVRCQSVVVGYCRILDRAGKPEYFGITRVFSPMSVMRRTLFERLFIQRHVRLEEVVEVAQSAATDPDRLLCKLSALEGARSSRDDISIITRLNAKFALDFIKHSPAAATMFLQRKT
jgi:8-oxo-dGTP pyrophosphatase MutT (NUDIX family)